MFGAVEDASRCSCRRSMPWLAAEKLQREHDAVGFFLSAHPLDEYRAVLEKMRVQTWAEFSAVRSRAAPRAGRLAATVTARQERRTRTGNKMAVLQLSDSTGSFEAVAFSEELREVSRPARARQIGRRAGRGRGAARRASTSASSRSESLDKVMAGLKQIRVFVRDEAPLPSVEKQLGRQGRGRGQPRSDARRRRREVEMRLPGPLRGHPADRQRAPRRPGRGAGRAGLMLGRRALLACAVPRWPVNAPPSSAAVVSARAVQGRPVQISGRHRQQGRRRPMSSSATTSSATSTDATRSSSGASWPRYVAPSRQRTGDVQSRRHCR